MALMADSAKLKALPIIIKTMIKRGVEEEKEPKE
jgi:hypothetical protein